MGDPIQAHMMLYEKDKDAAEGYARDLELLNTQRKNEVKDIISDISFDHDVYTNDVVVVGDMSWGPGILGLIAQKIIDETGKPVFVWGQGEDKIEVKGSCRSRGDISVVDLMAHVGHDVFTHWGGHEQAGGFSVHVDRISALSDGLNESINHIEKKQLDEQMAVPDATITLDDIHEVTYKAIEVLAPFGVGNPKPLFELQNLVPLATKWFGKKSEHFEVMYQSAGGKKVKAIQFFAPRTIEEKVNKEHTLHAHLEKSYFGGKVELRLRVVAVI
jgi:single-stranded-DNA-specific exonuclease